MKKLFLISFLLLTGQAYAQQCIDMLWHKVVIGGAKGYYTKTHEINFETMSETNVDFGDQFDNQSMQIPVEDIIVKDNEERVITRYSDKYAVIIFKNISDFKADVYYYSQMFDDVESAKAFQPIPEQFSTWYTPAGYTLEMMKPELKIFTKADAIEVAKLVVAKNTAMKEKVKSGTLDQQSIKQLTAALLLNAVPIEWAMSKGVNPYKSLAVIEAGMKKFKEDKDVLKIINQLKK